MKGIYLLHEDDPTFNMFKELLERNRLTPLERAEKSYNLLVTLHKTSSSHRPALNGNSRTFIIENLGISKSLLSQYLSIHKNILSQKVKDEMLHTALGVRPSYIVSLTRGKNAAETEMLQLAKIHELTKDRRTTYYHRKRGVRM